jgi:hypothetical protein
MVEILMGLCVAFIIGLVLGRGHGPTIVEAVRDCATMMFKAAGSAFKRLRRRNDAELSPIPPPSPERNDPT